MSDAAIPVAPRAAPSPHGRSLSAVALQRLLRDRWAMAGLACVTLVVLCAVLAPLLWRVAPAAGVAAPSLAHPLGVDLAGDDMLGRTLDGLRTSLLIAVVATATALGVGFAFGVSASKALSRPLILSVIAVARAAPLMIVLIFVLALLRSASVMTTALALGIVLALRVATSVHARAEALWRADFVDAARASGLPPLLIALRHVAPNLLGPLTMLAVETAPRALLGESVLSFLGAGASQVSLGGLLASGVSDMHATPWALAPALALFLLLGGLTAFADGVRRTKT